MEIHPTSIFWHLLCVRYPDEDNRGPAGLTSLPAEQTDNDKTWPRQWRPRTACDGKTCGPL